MTSWGEGGALFNKAGTSGLSDNSVDLNDELQEGKGIPSIRLDSILNHVQRAIGRDQRYLKASIEVITAHLGSDRMVVILVDRAPFARKFSPKQGWTDRRCHWPPYRNFAAVQWHRS